MPGDIARTPQTGEASTVHKPFGKPGGPGLWHTGKQLPAYIQSVAHHLAAQGHDESKAIEMAVGIVRNWAEGHDGHGRKVHADVQAAAGKAMAEWEKLRAEAHSKSARRAQVIQRVQLKASSVNNLPDSAFAYIEPGGSKDASGRTVPRSLRHFPVHDALARAPQSPFGTKAMPKIRQAAKKLGVDVSTDTQPATRAEYVRLYQLEDIHILRSADGGDGRTVEAYAAVFGQEAEIKDHEGHYIEVIEPTAFSRAIDHAQRARVCFPGSVKVLYNHGMTINGTPSERFSMPIGVPVDIRAEVRGLLTRTSYSETPLADEVLENIRAGSITSQSFTGRIMRSDPQLRRGDRYSPGSDGALRTVRRTELGLREYGPVLWPAYSGAEILGVRMSTPGGDLDPDEPDDAEGTPPDDGPATGDPLPQEEEHSARYHQHALYLLRAKEQREAAGLVW